MLCIRGEIVIYRPVGEVFDFVADKRNEWRNIPTVRGGARWYPASVRSVLRTREAELAARAS